MPMDTPTRTRRNFLLELAAGSGAVLAGCSRSTTSTAPIQETAAGAADVTLRIAPVQADIAKDHTISTIGYNGQVPGPLIRLREGVPVTVDIFNDTDAPEYVHWHGQVIPADVDGAPEEESLVVPAHGHIRY